MPFLNKLQIKGPVQTVLGHRIAEPKPTWQGLLLLVAAVSVPVLIAGSILDAAMQWFFGFCTGLWCFV